MIYQCSSILFPKINKGKLLLSKPQFSPLMELVLEIKIRRCKRIRNSPDIQCNIVKPKHQTVHNRKIYLYTCSTMVYLQNKSLDLLSYTCKMNQRKSFNVNDYNTSKYQSLVATLLQELNDFFLNEAMLRFTKIYFTIQYLTTI